MISMISIGMFSNSIHIIITIFNEELNAFSSNETSSSRIVGRSGAKWVHKIYGPEQMILIHSALLQAIIFLGIDIIYPYN